MARLQAGGLRLNRQWSLLEGDGRRGAQACRRTLGARRRSSVRLPADLPLLQLDAVLMERLFSNLLENAAKYTPRRHAALDRRGASKPTASRSCA